MPTEGTIIASSQAFFTKEYTMGSIILWVPRYIKRSVLRYEVKGTLRLWENEYLGFADELERFENSPPGSLTPAELEYKNRVRKSQQIAHDKIVRCNEALTALARGDPEPANRLVQGK
jgi:hypothetical protein